MKIYYSPSEKGFFIDDTGEQIPDDVIEISSEKHQEMLHEINMNNKNIVIIDGSITYEDARPLLTWDKIRKRRNKLLMLSDYTQVNDWPGDKQAWVAYRQALRNIPQNYSNPEDVIWPNLPA
jgi:uridine kinase